MAIQTINIGVLPNDGTGDPLRVAFEKINNNFTQLSASASAAPPDGAIQFRDTNTLVASGFLAGVYVLFGDGGRYYESSDGVNWVQVTSFSPNNNINQVITAGSTLIAVGDNGTILSGTSNGTTITWTSPSVTSISANLNAVVFDGTNYVAVGSGGAIYTSSDTITWTSRTSGTTNNLFGVSYGSFGGITTYCAVGAAGTAVTSTNFTTWTLNNAAGVTTTLRSITFAIISGTPVVPTFIAAGDGGVLVSTATISLWNLLTSGTTQNLQSITTANSLVVAAGSNGVVISSPTTALSWTPRVSGSTSQYNAINYYGATWYGVGNNGAIYTSTDLTNWTNESIAGTLQGSANLIYDVTNSNVLLGSNIIPTYSNVSLGSNASPFKDLWLAGNSLHIGTFTLAQSNNQTLTVTNSLSGAVGNIGNVQANWFIGNTVQTGDVIAVNGNFSGNLTVGGNTTIGNTGLTVGNVLIQKSSDPNGIQFVQTGNNSNFANLLLNAVTANNTITSNLTVTNAVTVATFTAGNATVTGTANINVINANIVGGVSGNIGNVQLANGNVTATNVSSNTVTANVATITSVTSNTVTANVANANIANIKDLVVSNTANLGAIGNVTITGGITGQSLTTDGAGHLSWTTVVTSPAGTNTQVQFNDGGVFGADTGFTYNKTTNQLNVDNIQVANNIAAGNAVIADLRATAIIANTISASQGITGQLVTAAQPNITQVGTLTGLAVSGLLTSGNAQLGNSAVANYFTGNFYGQANTAVTAGTVTTASQPNITSVGILTGLNVSGTISAPTASITTVTGNLVGNSTGLHTGAVTGNVTGNIIGTTGTFSGTVTGDTVTASYGAFSGTLNAGTGIFTGAVSAPTFTGNLSGNTTGQHTGQVIGNVTGNISGATGTFTGNVSSGNLATGNIAATGNITAGNITGANLISGNYLHGILDATSSSQPNITFVGNLTQANIDGNLYVGGGTNTGNLTVRDATAFGGNVTISGNLTVTGTTTYSNTVALNVENPIIFEGGGPNGAPLTNNDGKDRGLLSHYYTTTPVDAFFGWKNTSGQYILASNANVSAGSLVTVNNYANLKLDTVIGNIAGATGAFTGNVSAANISFSGSITGNGNNLSNLRVQDYLAAGNNIQLATANGVTTITANLTTAAAGNVTEVQFAGANGLFDASNALTFASNTLSAPTFSGNLTGNVTGTLTGNVSGNITGGNGTFTGNLQAANITATANLYGNLVGNVVSANSFTTNTAAVTTLTVSNTITATNAITGGSLITTGNANSGNVNTTNIVASGNANLGYVRITNANITSVTSPLVVSSLNDVTIQGNATAGSNTNVFGGNATGATAGGAVNITGGISASGDNGNINITGGQSSTSGANAGIITIRGGNAVNDVGGAITISGGTATGSTGGNVTITGGGGTSNGKLTLNRLVFPDGTGTNKQVLGVDGTGNIVFANVIEFAAGNSTEVQFNSGGNFAASNAFRFDNTANTLSISNALVVGNSLASTTIRNTSNTTTGTTTQTIAQWANTTWRSARLVVNTDDGTDGNTQSMTVNITSYGGNVNHSLTGLMKSGTNYLANYSVSASGGNIILTTSPAVNKTLNHYVNVEYYN